MARHVVWGEHGVVVITFHDTLWLFDVHRGSTGLVLESRQHMSMPLVRSLVLSPDQVHLCMVQCAQIARGKFSRSLVILNVISGSQALIPLPEHLTSDDMPNWSKTGFSVAVPLRPDGRFLYRTFRFVF